jgi:hypothetical protein
MFGHRTPAQMEIAKWAEYLAHGQSYLYADTEYNLTVLADNEGDYVSLNNDGKMGIF